MNEFTELERVLHAGSPAEIDEAASQYGLVRTVHEDACDNCKSGVSVGYDHRSCMTLVPGSDVRY